MKIWIIKHLRDLRSGKPETDVYILTTSADDAQEYIEGEAATQGFVPFDFDEAEAEACGIKPKIWYNDELNEFLELEEREIDV